ncbi:MAG: hypothetical protein JWP35_1760 [Caulobacter sp.]|nr:hypothetical protein [Caulobacter sp.]
MPMRNPTIIAAIGASVCAGVASLAWADEPVGPPQDVYEMVKAVGPPTAQAKMRGDQRFEKTLTMGRGSDGQLAITSMQALGPDQKPALPAGTVAVLYAHYQGQCAAPNGADDFPASQGVATFVISSSGASIWEIAAVNGVTSIRLVKDGGFGPWEAFQANPERYAVYRCDKYR